MVVKQISVWFIDVAAIFACIHCSSIVNNRNIQNKEKGNWKKKISLMCLHTANSTIWWGYSKKWIFSKKSNNLRKNKYRIIQEFKFVAVNIFYLQFELQSFRIHKTKKFKVKEKIEKKHKRKAKWMKTHHIEWKKRIEKERGRGNERKRRKNMKEWNCRR